MKNEKETRNQLLASAKKEFLEKGYMKASLRNICKNAGVTTGALYFFFQDKEDLFASLVNGPVEKLYEIMTLHYAKEIQNADAKIDIEGDRSEDMETAQQMIHYIYLYKEEFDLVLTKSQGTRFEHTVDRFVAVSEEHYRRLADEAARQLNKKKLDDYMVHWLAHMSVDAFVHMITHELTEEEAKKHIEDITTFVLSGWIRLVSRSFK